ncbi:phage repressor [Lachnospiraceae bacterium KM106-2]|nr:phage repressor [Lachnospiraceae bacterium KM106-2]
MKKIGKTLSRLRIKKGLSQTDVAQKISDLLEPTTSQKVSKWETDYSIPSAYQFLALCQVYGIHDVLQAFSINKPSPLSLNEEGRRKLDEYHTLLIASGMFKEEGASVISMPRRLKLFDLPVSAGTGEFLDSDSFEYIEVGNEVPESADFGVKINGNSMEPRFVSGQIVWVHKQDLLADGEIGIFAYDGNAYCKKLSMTTAATKLISLNTAYQPIEVAKNATLHVFGKVVG